MFLNNALEHFRRDGVVPRSIGIDDRNGTLLANAQAICFRAVNGVVRFCQSEFFEPLLQVLPRCQAFFLWRAYGFRLIRAQENVPPDSSNSRSDRLVPVGQDPIDGILKALR